MGERGRAEGGRGGGGEGGRWLVYVAVSRRVLEGGSVSAEAFVVKIGLKEGLASA